MPKFQTLEESYAGFEAGPLSRFPEHLRPLLRFCFFCGALSDYKLTDNIALRSDIAEAAGGDPVEVQATYSREMQEMRDLIIAETAYGKISRAAIVFRMGEKVNG